MSLYVLDEFVVTKLEKHSGCSGVKLPSINQFCATSNGGNGKPYLTSSRALRPPVTFWVADRIPTTAKNTLQCPFFLSNNVN